MCFIGASLNASLRNRSIVYNRRDIVGAFTAPKAKNIQMQKLRWIETPCNCNICLVKYCKRADYSWVATERVEMVGGKESQALPFCYKYSKHKVFVAAEERQLNEKRITNNVTRTKKIFYRVWVFRFYRKLRIFMYSFAILSRPKLLLWTLCRKDEPPSKLLRWNYLFQDFLRFLQKTCTLPCKCFVIRDSSKNGVARRAVFSSTHRWFLFFIRLFLLLPLSSTLYMLHRRCLCNASHCNVIRKL